MDKQLQDFLLAKTKELVEAPSCCAEIKEAAKTWQAALGTAGEAAANAQYKRDLESVIVPIDGLIAFAASPEAIKVFGAEVAEQVHAHGIEIKAEGKKFCDCPACAAAQDMIEKL